MNSKKLTPPEFQVKKIVVDKIAVGRRQLIQAVDLYFKNGDEISVHTLASAALEVLDSVMRHWKRMPYTDNILDLYIKPEGKKTWLQKMNEAKNFFKHADKDPIKQYEFNPRQTDWIIICAIDSLRKLTGEDYDQLHAYEWWFMSRNLSILKADAENKDHIADLAKNYTDKKKLEYYQDFLKSIAIIKTKL